MRENPLRSQTGYKRRPGNRGGRPSLVVENLLQQQFDVAGSFFQLLKRERIRRRVYAAREQARADIFDYIEMFYNPMRRHSHAGDRSSVEF